MLLIICLDESEGKKYCVIRLSSLKAYIACNDSLRDYIKQVHCLAAQYWELLNIGYWQA